MLHMFWSERASRSCVMSYTNQAIDAVRSQSLLSRATIATMACKGRACFNFTILRQLQRVLNTPLSKTTKMEGHFVPPRICDQESKAPREMTLSPAILSKAHGSCKQSFFCPSGPTLRVRCECFEL